MSKRPREDDDETAGAAKRQAESWRELGNAAFKKGDSAAALRMYDKAVDSDPANPLLYSNRSAAHAKLGHWTQAESDAEMLTRLSPDFAKGWGRLGSALLGQKRYEEAAPAFARAAELDTANADYARQRDMCRQRAAGGQGVAGSTMRADFYKEKHKRQGLEEFKKGNYTASVRYFTKAIDDSPVDHVLHSNRAGSYLKLAAEPTVQVEQSLLFYQRALADGDTCVRLKSDWAKGHARRGSALHGLRRHGEALQAFRDGLAAEPGSKACEDGLKAVEKHLEEAKEEDERWEEQKVENKAVDKYLEEHPDACVIPDRKLPSVFCWKCGQEGHFPSNCTAKVQKGILNGGYAQGYDQCFHCGQYGHTKSRCPAKGGGGGGGGGGGSVPGFRNGPAPADGGAPMPSSAVPSFQRQWASAYEYKDPQQQELADATMKLAGVTRRMPSGAAEWREGGKGGAAGGRR
eukprot:TRINITY_DN3670_c1_g1_i1.p2 TRINITY_DN3670_c1_g1~~TRINITY_DN3670_c1_g1_i1.p2  ORF type:complete len:477 (+),score=192.22 TRINITY_DN3670_c1_g1_i1:50-1432(+)